MRSLIVGLALLASTPTFAIDKSAENLLKGASAQAAIQQFCSDQFQVDADLSTKLGKAAHDAAFQVLGEADGDTEFRGELSRRFDEVKSAGPHQWCRNQRATYNEYKIPVFKN
ncbi:hypothetical protein [Methylobacterium sp. WL7]|uniref:hypothetical protein n=1 Tax=Methylobacterium sp. WL7 TaxID=2603900 RepID=UPI0011C8417B|nr:hypothetical protein [Methylobacterium sp. WL7]TXN43584.1 hypothetical protein FV233_17965 [Methylobacterium sp. WL7]